MNCYIKSTDYNGFAIAMKDVSVCKCQDFMTKHNLNLDWVDHEGCNLLMYAIRFNAVGFMWWLVDCGIDCRQGDSYGKNSYDYIADSEFDAVMIKDFVKYMDEQRDIKLIVKKSSEIVKLQFSIVNNGILKQMRAIYNVMLDCGVTDELAESPEESPLDLHADYLYLFNLLNYEGDFIISNVTVDDENVEIEIELDDDFDCLNFGSEFWDLEKVRGIVAEHMDMCRLNEKG